MLYTPLTDAVLKAYDLKAFMTVLSWRDKEFYTMGFGEYPKKKALWELYTDFW